MTTMRRLASISLVLSAALLLGRLAGFVREMQLGAVLGVSREADFAVVMLTTPDLLVNLLLTGGLSAALIPEFGRLDEGGRTRAFLLTSGMVTVLFGTIAVLIAAFPSLLMFAFAPGYANSPVSEYADIFAITALAIPFAGLAGVTTALLNAGGKFLIAGVGTLIFNATLIASIALWANPGRELVVLAVGIAVASLLRYACQLVSCFPNFSMAPSRVASTDYSRLAMRFVQALGASTLVLFVPVILRAMISMTGAGNMAAYNFSSKLVELPLGIAITTISAVAFPSLSKAVTEGDTVHEEEVFVEGVKRSVLLSLCIAIPCIYFSDDLVSFVFGRGSMKSEDLQLISELAQIGFVTLPFIAVSTMASALLNARGQMAFLLKMTVIVTLLVPVLTLPGIVKEDVYLSLFALPLFHAVYAVFLASATRQPVFSSWRFVVDAVGSPLLSGVAGTAICGVIWSLIGAKTPVLGSALALCAIVISVALATGASYRRKAE